MDSQKQYEALLAQWGYKDTTVEDHARRQKRARQAKAIAAFFKTSFRSIKKISLRSQTLSQAS
ncbi:hypothetical protein [Marinomonas posidonica]|uniref:Uncharacterized protein n=1 Tax=Marinomonas posidonica (strain CECT 7376 / NCIMB 14433 / IVIA-Po-181) TaxID=491952 RepID=F6CXZ3_MARPP|nr:hypothetical protein [Marinomonas posidonica]AEF54555.1 hypothetical protein Mar181_1512 [Marinomonas posidonica IVIA-Po-181]